MARSKQKGRMGPGKMVLLSFSAFIILAGVWLISSNLISFSKGFFAGEKVESTPLPESPKPKPQENEVKKESEEQSLYPVRPKIGDKMGTLFIPKIQAKLPIFHGTNEDELEKGVGHFKDSVLPGEKDNSVLSGHRDTVFRSLGKVGRGDKLIVETAAGTFTYKVRKVRIVDKDDRTVIVPKPRAVLTVSTCYPFDFVGASPQRYILEAFLVSEELNKP